ncbi:hypothetical protein LOH54_07800 [Sulfurimonas sp. HSL-3221]|uniref:hypothetical protein n=1 Tax=Thiomicrolovo sulfuroxydans TaxID=2894755 RepID=UPI001E5E1087|nr:hypothetical protein [Sulfurimonas sp. HSL-3221]UFS61565.1 hypothetical protein LOH54_07800 [Sulfurimonas sp. HSL-3221]
MLVVLYLIAFLLLFLLALLATPVELSLQLEKEETFDYRARLHWCFGLVSVDLTGLAKKAATVKKAKRKKRKTQPSKFPGGSVSAQSVTRLLRGLRRSLQVRELSLHGRIGLGDPACTGMLMGLLQPLLLPARQMSLVADYEEAVFEGRFSARVRLVPLRIFGVLLRFFFAGRR